jgi:hypothetical protein
MPDSGREGAGDSARREERVFGTLKKIFAAVVLVVALVLAAYAGFRWGSYVFPPVERLLGMGAVPAQATPEASSQPTAQLADSTLERFERLRSGKGGDRLALSGRELTAVVRFAVPELIPPGVSEPTVELRQGRIHLLARVATSAFPQLSRLAGMMGMLPDTVPLEMEGSLVPNDPEYMALVVDEVAVAYVPVPKSMVVDVLKGLHRRAPPTMPPDAVPVPIPDGVKSVYVQRDSLVLTAKR